MSNRNEIYDELVALSPLLADLSRVNPYQVPDDYFEELATRVNELVCQENFPLAGILPASVNAPYQVPDNFFTDFAGNLLYRLNSEEVTVSETMPAGVATPYEFPAGYFDRLADQVMNRIKALEVTTHQEELGYLSPMLRNLNKPTPFVLPDGYFDDFAGDLLDGVHAVDFVNAELEEHSPLMASVRTNNVYKVPPGYFDALAGKIFQQIKRHKNQGALVRAFSSRLVRYAAAAMVAGVIALSGWLYFGNDQQSDMASTGNSIQKITNEEMLNYLETAPVNELTNSDSYDLKADDVQDLLADVSDQELETYLHQHASTKDLNN